MSVLAGMWNMKNNWSERPCAVLTGDWNTNGSEQPCGTHRGNEHEGEAALTENRNTKGSNRPCVVLTGNWNTNNNDHE